MAQFDVYTTPIPSELVLDLQADALDHLTTRLVAPLVSPDDYGRSFPRMTPTFAINGKPYLLLAQYMAAAPVGDLQNKVANLEHEQYAIKSALDMLFYGF